jgi:hypothetical protein
MKNLLILILSSIPIISFSQIITDGLAGYWQFNETYLDGSANANNGNGVNTTFTYDRNDNLNSAVNFTGTNSYIDLMDYTKLNITGNQITISCWILIDAFNNYPGIISKGYASTGGYSIHIRDDNSIQFELDEFNGNRHFIKSLGKLEFAQWYHLTTTYDGDKMRIYINSQLDKEVVVGNFNIGTSTTSLKMGILPSYGYLDGKLDEVYIFSRALEDLEIVNIYNGSIVIPPTLSCDFEWKCNNNILQYNDGQVLIGTDNLNEDYLFGVKGKIKTEEILVTITDWPDYVFNSEYKLKTLNQLDKYIKVNKHLPNIPSEHEVIQEGILVGEMNVKLLEKIEELTLYMIELNKKFEKSQLELTHVKNKNIELEQKINMLEVTK